MKMWVMKNTSTGQLNYLLYKKQKYVVGRVGADVVLKKDVSISRRHACLEFQEPISASSTLLLRDLGSSNGTFLNDLLIPTNSPVELCDGDRIRFGVLENNWTVTKFSWITMTSSMPQEKTKELEEYMSSLGGAIVNKWEDRCTHLTMVELTATVKVLYALLYNIPMVTCDYWRHLLQAAQKGQDSLPKPEMYFPKKCDTIQKSMGMDFGSNPARNSIFKGKTFVFMNKRHFDMYGPLVQKAGGACTDLHSGVQKSVLIKPNVVTIQYVPSTESQLSQTLRAISDFLESNNRRIIPEYEIGLAIIYCSANTYCNPTCILPPTMPGIEQLNSNNTTLSPGKKTTETDLEMPEPDETLTQANNDECSGTAGSSNRSQLKRNYKVSSEDEQPCKKPSLCKPKWATNKNAVPMSTSAMEQLDINFINNTQFPETDLGTPSDDTLTQVNDKVIEFELIANSSGTAGSSKQNLLSSEEYYKIPTKLKRERNDVDEILTQVNDEIIKFVVRANSSEQNMLPSTSKVEGAGFLNKTYQHSQACTSTMYDGKSTNYGIKRGRLAVITDDSDDDESDLFNFHELVPSVGEEFTFHKTSPNTSSERKVIPKKISTEGWFCCSTKKNVISIGKYGGFEVRLINRDQIKSRLDSTNTCTNFKKFIKKYNYKPQSRIVKVIPMTIIPSRKNKRRRIK